MVSKWRGSKTLKLKHAVQQGERKKRVSMEI
jgi:hypothetical protein